MGIPVYVHPLDNITESSVEKNVGFPGISVWQTELGQPAMFIESSESYIEERNTTSISTKYGFTISLWIKIKTNSTQRIPILDTGSKTPLYLYLKFNQIHLQYCPKLDCSQPKFVMSHTMMKLNVWTFVAVTYDIFNDIGTFYINGTYGAKETEGRFFSFNSIGGFNNDVVGNSLIVGATYKKVEKVVVVGVKVVMRRR